MPPPRTDSLGSSGTAKFYATNAVNIDLAATKGAPCRFLRANTAGNIAVELADGTSDTFPFLAGETQALSANKILTSGTSVGIGITVFW